ncbi:hypothetical protein EWM64_g5395 [Hericium alpestre]|uniref:General transcription and DNA repair factor IIH subunit TFB5 n=2 Tax=Hericium alpestre TaxID=135208 RepID=A0A4Y9ZYY6_9AGAM|nr:hypothetical protein EWM64_g5395 [Hericium alpestre]
MKHVHGALLTHFGAKLGTASWSSEIYSFLWEYESGKSDSAVKQILLAMNEHQSFIIEDLDEFHVVIKADEEYRVRKELEAELEKNMYSFETSQS